VPTTATTIEHSRKKPVRGFSRKHNIQKKPEKMSISLRENWALNLDAQFIAVCRSNTFAKNEVREPVVV